MVKAAQMSMQKRKSRRTKFCSNFGTLQLFRIPKCVFILKTLIQKDFSILSFHYMTLTLSFSIEILFLSVDGDRTQGI